MHHLNTKAHVPPCARSALKHRLQLFTSRPRGSSWIYCMWPWCRPVGERVLPLNCSELLRIWKYDASKISDSLSGQIRIYERERETLITVCSKTVSVRRSLLFRNLHSLFTGLFSLASLWFWILLPWRFRSLCVNRIVCFRVLCCSLVLL